MGIKVEFNPIWRFEMLVNINLEREKKKMYSKILPGRKYL